jgi:hypothetical protein
MEKIKKILFSNNRRENVVVIDIQYPFEMGHRSKAPR